MGQPDVCGPAEAVADMRSRVQLTGSVVEAPLATPDARILHRRRRACAACLMAEERAHMLSVYSHSFFFFFFPFSLCSHPTPGRFCLQKARRNPPLVFSSSSYVAISSLLVQQGHGLHYLRQPSKLRAGMELLSGFQWGHGVFWSVGEPTGPVCFRVSSSLEQSEIFAVDTLRAQRK